MKKQEILARVGEILAPLAQEFGYDIVDVEYEKEGTNWYLKVFSDKEGGFSINDCVDLSRALEKKLDEADFIEEAYILEVSSPGLDRPLKKESDFVRYNGELVEVKLYKADKEKGLLKEFTAELNGYDSEKEIVTLVLDNGETVELPMTAIALIRRAVIF